MDLLIEGDRESLEWISGEIRRRIGDDARMEERLQASSGAFSEPILIALIIALGGKEITLAIRDILARRYAHLEKMREVEVARELNLKLILDDDTESSIKLTDIPD